jgi:hypothetical protein
MELLISVKFRRVSVDKAMRRAKVSRLLHLREVFDDLSWISTIGAILSRVSNCGEYPALHRVLCGE